MNETLAETKAKLLKSEKEKSESHEKVRSLDAQLLTAQTDGKVDSDLLRVLLVISFLRFVSTQDRISQREAR